MAILMCFFIPSRAESRNVAAAGSIEITGDMTFSNETINITGISGPVFSLTDGVTVEFNNVTITGTGSFDTIFEVIDGHLILDNVIVDVPSCTYVVENYWHTTIKGLTVTGTSTYDIYNSSEYCTIEKVDINSLYLAGGFITVNGDTEIEGVISTNVAASSYIKLVVDGDGVFAGKFIDNFDYIGNYKAKNPYNPFGPEYYAELDYVGSLNKLESDTYLDGTGVSPGDIALTLKTGLDASGNYIIPSYATMNSYLAKNPGKTITCSGGGALQDSLVADNYHMTALGISPLTISSSTNYLPLAVNSMYNGSVDSTQNISMGIDGYWLVFVDRLAEDYTISSSSNITYEKLYDCNTHIALLAKHDTSVSGSTGNISVDFKTVQAITVTPVAVQKTFEYDGQDHFDELELCYYYADVKFPILAETVEMVDVGVYNIPVYTNDANVVLSQSTVQVTVTAKPIDIVYSQTSYTYTGADITVSANAEGVITGDTVNILLTNNVKREVGDYVVTATIDNDNYVIKDGDDSYTFSIGKIRLEEEWEDIQDITAQYTGTKVLPDISELEEIDGISVTVDYEEDPINVGEYTVTVTISLIDIVHYEEISAAKSYYECKVKINPREVTPHLEQSSFTYTGDIPTLDLYFTGMVNNEEVKGMITPLTSAIVGGYAVTCELDTQDPVTANYVIASGKEKINVSINKATISMLSVTFVDEERPYLGEVYVPQVSGLPSTVNVEYVYDNDIYLVGSHVVTANFSLKDAVNYEPLTVTSKSMTLTITVCKINVKDVKLSGLTVDYDGNPHGLSLSNLPQHVTYSVTKNDYVDAGTYTITFTIQPENSNYSLFGRDSMELSATLVINKIDYDLTGIIFEDKTVIYNATAQTISMTGTLPQGLTVEDTNTAINVGDHTITLRFINSSSNHNTPDNMTATLTISAKVLTISLSEANFTYSGEPYTVEYVLDGIEGSDVVTVELLNATNTMASNYTAVVDSISNSNYTVNTRELSYVINKANVNMNGIALQSKQIEYFGAAYTPELSGELPAGVTCTIIHPEIKNVGRYDIVATFAVNSNYNKPANIPAVIEILPKSLVVNFTDNLNLMYNGNIQYITVNVVGLVDNEEYSIVYSDEPKEPGNYSCEVILSATSNYKINGDTKCYFDIHTDTKTYTSDEYSLTVSNGMFKADNPLLVDKVQLSKEVENKVKALHEEMVFMDSIKIIADHSEEEISVSLELKELNLNKNKAITVYRLGADGSISEIDYDIVGNTIRFSSLPNSSYIVVSDKVDNSLLTLLIVILVLFTAVLGFSVAMIIRNVKLKKNKLQ